MDIQKAFSFITEDEQWVQKLAVGVGVILVSGLLSVVLVGILGYLILAGYGIRLLQNVRDGVAKPLPEWNDWGGDLSRGFKYAVVGFIWALPLMLLTIPSSIGGILAENGGDAGSFLGAIIMVCSSCLSFVYGIFVWLAGPGFTISFARDEKISSGLMLTDIWAWTRQNLGQVIIAALVVMGAGLVFFLGATVFGALLCIVGLILTWPLAGLAVTLVQHHLYGQLARSYPMAPVHGATPVPPAPVAPVGEAPFTAPAESELRVDDIAAETPGEVATGDMTYDEMMADIAEEEVVDVTFSEEDIVQEDIAIEQIDVTPDDQESADDAARPSA
jgi:hypothetical protein